MNKEISFFMAREEEASFISVLRDLECELEEKPDRQS